ncbi:MAG: SPFH domain-containing protein, partial [Sediminibacterium sp.]
MVLIIIGLLFILGAAFINKEKEEFSKFKKGVRFFGLAVVVLGVLTSCIKQIDAGQIGVQSLFGKVSDHVLTSGLNTVNPLVDIKKVDIKTQNYTMSGVHDEGDKEGDDAIRVLTADGLEVV